MITMCTVRSTDADGAIEEHWQVYDPGTAKRLAAGVGRKFPDRRIDVKQETITHVVTSIMIPADELEGLPQAKAASTANDWSNRAWKGKVPARLDR
jgi:hypothetical protein